MKVSELIEDLEREWEAHGDHEVVVEDDIEGVERDVRRVTTMVLYNGKYKTTIAVS